MPQIRLLNIKVTNRVWGYINDYSCDDVTNRECKYDLNVSEVGEKYEPTFHCGSTGCRQRIVLTWGQTGMFMREVRVSFQ